MQKMSATEAIKPIKWLIGKWHSVKASGKYPGINSFEYQDEIEFSYFGQPLLSYSSKTKFADNTPKHYESGFLKIKPGTNNLSFILAHNFGLTSMEEGVVEGCVIKLKSSEITRNSFSKGAAVCKIEREYELCNDELEMKLLMETSTKPLSEHLRVTYKKVE